ncbi:hypothetical protein PLEOSDRAFT_169801 [Pleurotus ostreatus PC15]|uniref:Uncharacterized protein n=1 Tax=Pleurotus ostreatus (strain PC15) TaxID=1137138 RepID=A0A067ND73_PLEO1|nr:hypothetical protein PLEOSDRAFT_169801 [Pleurotus ostreatus PC15]
MAVELLSPTNWLRSRLDLPKSTGGAFGKASGLVQTTPLVHVNAIASEISDGNDFTLTHLGLRLLSLDDRSHRCEGCPGLGVMIWHIKLTKTSRALVGAWFELATGPRRSMRRADIL